MKFPLFIICFFSVITFSTAQSRVDRVEPVFVNKSVGINQATGWTQNKEGKWVSNQNLISQNTGEPDAVRSFYKNFDWLRSAKLTYNGKVYYAFYYRCQKGEYKYPSLMQDWESEAVIESIVVDSAAYAKFRNSVLHKEAGDKELIGWTALSSTTKIDDAAILPLLAYPLEKGMSENASRLKFIANVQKDNGADIVRFELPMSFSDYDHKAFVWSSYFEVPYDEFVKLFVD